MRGGSGSDQGAVPVEPRMRSRSDPRGPRSCLAVLVPSSAVREYSRTVSTTAPPYPVQPCVRGIGRGRLGIPRSPYRLFSS
eukprot:983353-Prymnesium_polylepis.1